MLKLNGKPFAIHSLTPWHRNLLDRLNGLPHDEVFTADGIAKKFSLKVSGIQDAGNREEFASYTFRDKRYFAGRIWGNPKAITALQSELRKVRE